MIDVLKETLLSLGGKRVHFPEIEEDLAQILSRGRHFPNRNTLVIKGLPNKCHENTARLWEANPKSLDVVTGYSLGTDGIWRPHSWGLSSAMRIIETTVVGASYFGFVLTDSETGRFIYENT